MRMHLIVLKVCMYSMDGCSQRKSNSLWMECHYFLTSLRRHQLIGIKFYGHEKSP